MAGQWVLGSRPEDDERERAGAIADAGGYWVPACAGMTAGGVGCTRGGSRSERDRTKPIIGDRRLPSPLDKIQPDGWLNEYTTDLMDLLHVLGRLVLLEPRQADLMTRILAEPLIKVDALTSKTDNSADS